MKLEFTERKLDEKTIVQARFHTTKLPGGENLLIIAFKRAEPVQRNDISYMAGMAYAADEILFPQGIIFDCRELRL